ncbi:MAG: cation:proton antiporter [Odoribacteraceae bacterium]|jgi:CPA2 family monovalent cation:H+ antiporter-2|nr:cation:proton antiporter [Odoribacteraceae bacterium]
MSHLAPLISDLALILITAGITTILFKRLKQPVVLGYIVAGFLISPRFYLLPSVADPGNIQIWADIGIVFLLFALGLEFSFRRLMAVGGTASVATLLNMGSMIIVGYLIGQWVGWTPMESIFLGGMLSMSSTTIIIKAFNDMGLQKKKFAGIVFGMLIVEDLAAILMMVLLSTVAVSKHFAGMELIENVARLLFFIVIWFVGGIYIVPSLLKRFRRFLDDEVMLVVAVGLCLGMVLFASAAGFSAALGAFIMGSILAETIDARRVEHLIEPLKNLFGAVFFVSVGMMLSPEIFAGQGWMILICTVAVLVGRVIFATLGVLASGEGLKVALQSGFSLAQIGEFSFIIATLGMQLGVISAFIYPMIVTVSIITTFTTPYFIRLAGPANAMLERVIPAGWRVLVDGYSASRGKSVNRQGDWARVWRSVLSKVAVFLLLSIAALLLSRQYVIPFITGNVPGAWGATLAAAVSLLFMAPFLAGLVLPGRKTRAEFSRLWTDSPFYKGLLISLMLSRVIACMALILQVLIPLFPVAKIPLVLVAFIIMLALVFFEGFKRRPERMEKLFMENLTEKERVEESGEAINRQVRGVLLDKNVHVEEIDVPREAAILGKTLAELNFKQRAGVNVISITRGSRRLNIPDGGETIFPLDKITVVGSDEEIQQFMQVVQEGSLAAGSEEPLQQIALSRYAIEEGSPLIGRSIKELKVREKTGCLVIGINRGGEEITGLDADLALQQDDLLWLAGEEGFLSAFETNLLA